MARLAMALVALLAFGCSAASIPAPPSPILDDRPGFTRGQRPEVACLPPGMPPFAGWSDGPIFRRGDTTDVLGGGIRVVARYHSVGAGSDYALIVGFWHARHGGHTWRLYALDPAPGDPAVPFWYDASVVSVDSSSNTADHISFQFASEAEAACDWRRVGLGEMRI